MGPDESLQAGSATAMQVAKADAQPGRREEEVGFTKTFCRPNAGDTKRFAQRVCYAFHS